MTEAKIQDPHHSDIFKQTENPYVLHNLQLPLIAADFGNAFVSLENTLTSKCFYLNVTIEVLDRMC